MMSIPLIMYWKEQHTDMGGTNVPAFLTKIWTLVDDPSTDELIAWDASGISFHVYDQARFAKEILPRYFKHNNIASFIRQLNMYGFRKVVHVGEGAMKSESDDVEFKHPYFSIGNEHLLEYIKRKPSGQGPMSVKTDAGGIRCSQDDVQKVLGDVNEMKGKQDHFTVKMDTMKKENEALWRELANLRQKHIKQQQIVNKLIQFMIHLVGGKRGLAQAAGIKRKMPLMINDSSQVAKQKRPSYNKQFSIEEMPTDYVVNSPQGTRDPAATAGSGPIIHDVTDMYRPPATTSIPSIASNSSSSTSTSDVKYPTSLMPNNVSVNDPSDIPGMLPSLDSTDLNALVDSNLLMPDEPLQSVGQLERFMKDHLIGPTSTITLPPAVNGQLEHVQDELDGLRDLLSGGQYNIDASTLTNIFSGETGGLSATVPRSVDSLLGMAEDKMDKEDASGAVTDPGTITGNELVSFQYMSPESLMNAGLVSPVPDLQDLISSEDIAGALMPEDDTDNLDPLSFLNSLTSLTMPRGSLDMKTGHRNEDLD